MHPQATRRDFLKAAGLAGVGFWTSSAPARSASPNEKLNLAIVGPDGRGAANLSGVASENIVAICEVDGRRGGRAYERFPKAARYTDYRKLLETEKSIDAVVVSTPDHSHAGPSVMAMRLGKGVYCEKPLSHNVHEARVMAQVAAETGVATQTGTQIHAGDNYRRVVEIVRSGALGQVREAHVWVSKIWGGGDRPKETPPVPDNLAWDIWLGPAPYRPYHPTYLPKNWRRWWDFGSGTLGDMGCHYVDLPFWALDLKYPTAVEAQDGEVHPETAPTGVVARYEFPERPSSVDGATLPPVTLTWYDGRLTPKQLYGHKLPGSGVLFVGEKGQMLAGYSSYKLLPESQFADYQPPEPTIPRSIGHHREWLHSVKTGEPTTCHFGYGGPLTETVLLGTVAYRVGQRLEWDAESLKATNCPDEADAFLRREYRNGWSL